MLIEINLLPKKTRRTFSFIYVPISVVAVLLITFIIMLVNANQLKNEQAELDQKVERTTELLSVMQGNDSEIVNSADTLQQYVSWLDSVEFSTVKLLDDLVTRLPERGFFMEYAFDGDETVTVTVQFDQMNEVSQYLNELNQSDNVTSASVLTVQTAQLAEESEEDGRILPRYVTDYEIVINKENLRVEEETDG
ncbi:PilN domain-containing protein [Alkalihalobacillus sp. R86527]|uniref:PilN domain-containing protein n=1 Tax=Alkalihalobacillus sp. R86527 TaxID=3093863 RepID=UPI00366BAAAB